MAGYDVIEVEVHRKWLFNISKEMAITLMRTSGSPVVTDAKDFSTCILDAKNEQLAFSGFVSFHISTAFLGVEAVLRNYDVEALRRGDAFICNDPHLSGAIHQGDVGIVMPYFYKDKLVGWGYVNEHLLDVGGAAVSGFAPEARDCYSETLRFPGVRIMSQSVLAPEWEQFIAANVRMPGPVLNDIRSMIAANNVGQARLERLIDQIGLERFTQLNEVSKRLTDEALRARIAKLPDGTYDSEDWVEYDARGVAELHNIKCRLVKSGDEMTIQLRGGPQVDSFINGAKPAMLGQVMTTLLCQFMYDIPVNAGIWWPIHIDLGPAGTIVNSVEPAPVTQSHMETGMRVNKVVADVINQAVSLSTDEVLRSRVAGQTSNGIASLTAFGVDDRTGRPTVIFPISTAVGLGGPAQTVCDGLDTYAAQCMTGCGMPDVETDESGGPVLVLWRRIHRNSGGPGIFRGGQGMSSAMALVHSNRLTGAAFNSVAEVPPRGAFGGYPGGASTFYVLTSTNVGELLGKRQLPTEDKLQGKVRDYPAKTGSLVLDRNDVIVLVTGGGGGVGDPLLRSPHTVAKDVKDGYISAKHAREGYGVVVNDAGELDMAATNEERRRLRRERIDRDPAPTHPQAEAYITLGINDGRWFCTACGHGLSPAQGENWRSGAVVRDTPIEERYASMEMRVRARKDPGVVMREYFCPNCATALTVDVTLEGNEPVPASRPGVKALLA